MKTTKKVVFMMLAMLFIVATVWAQVTLPSAMYGEKVTVDFSEAPEARVSSHSAVSADGQLLAFSNYPYIYLGSYPNMRVAEIFDLTNVVWAFPTYGITNLFFHPNNMHLSYQTKIYDPGRGAVSSGSGGSNGLNTICMVNLQTGEHEVLIEGASRGEWSLDGRYMLYSVDDYRKYTIDPSAAVDDLEMAIYDAEAGETTFIRDILHVDSFITSGAYNSNNNITFSPDGTSIYYLCNPDGEDRYEQIYKASLDGSSITQVSAFDYTTLGDDMIKLFSIKISPDEKWAVLNTSFTPRGGWSYYLILYELSSGRLFSLLTGEELSQDIHEVVDYGDTVKTYVGNQIHPSFVGWHPDGETILLYTYEIGQSSELRYKAFDPDFYKSSPTAVASDIPAAFATIANFPNPFNPFTTVSYTVPVGGHTELSIYNLAGQKIRTLLSGYKPAGTHEVVWDGCDDNGMPVSSGLFVSRLKTGDTVVTHRMALVK